MEIKKISYLDPRVDLEDDCLDVFVTLEKNTSYLVEVTTPKFFYTLMKKSKKNFVPVGYLCIIVSKLTGGVIRSTIQEFIGAKEDSYWLKLYHIIVILNIEDINKILNLKEDEDIELKVKIDAEIERE